MQTDLKLKFNLLGDWRTSTAVKVFAFQMADQNTIWAFKHNQERVMSAEPDTNLDQYWV